MAMEKGAVVRAVAVTEDPVAMSAAVVVSMVVVAVEVVVMEEEKLMVWVMALEEAAVAAKGVEVTVRVVAGWAAATGATTEV